jgi:hypothetical protein
MTTKEEHKIEAMRIHRDELYDLTTPTKRSVTKYRARLKEIDDMEESND